MCAVCEVDSIAVPLKPILNPIHQISTSTHDLLVKLFDSQLAITAVMKKNDCGENYSNRSTAQMNAREKIALPKHRFEYRFSIYTHVAHILHRHLRACLRAFVRTLPSQLVKHTEEKRLKN